MNETALDYPALAEQFDPRLLPGDGIPVYPQLWADVHSPTGYIVRSAEALVRAAIKPAVRTSRTDPLPGGPGGPFGAACAVPERVLRSTDGSEVSFRTWLAENVQPERLALPFSHVLTWRIVALGTNLVQPLHHPCYHAEIVAQGYAGRAVGGRNFWKRFVLVATTGAPCAMCAASFQWSRPRWIIGGAPVSAAKAAGFHEAYAHEKMCEPVEADDEWIGKLRSCGIEVIPNVAADDVVEELYRPYLGPIYNSGADDPTG